MLSSTFKKCKLVSETVRTLTFTFPKFYGSNFQCQHDSITVCFLCDLSKETVNLMSECQLGNFKIGKSLSLFQLLFLNYNFYFRKKWEKLPSWNGALKGLYLWKTWLSNRIQRVTEADWAGGKEVGASTRSHAEQSVE